MAQNQKNKSPRKGHVMNAAAAKSTKKKNVGGRTESGSRRSVIVTFKPKDQRPDEGMDKLEIVNQVLEAPVVFFDAGMFPMEASGLPRGLATEAIGFDVNLYEAPIVVASLNDAEIAALSKNGNVEAIEEDGQVHALYDYPCRPEDSSMGIRRYQPLERFQVEGQPMILAETIPAGVSQIKAPAAWDCSRGKGMKVAVLDTGIDPAHPDIAPNYKGGISFVPGESPMDGNSHGTHCAGTIGAAINGAGVVGVAPAASLYAVKVLSNSGSGNWSWLIAGINWCIQNDIRIISMSLGGSSAPAALETMVNAAWAKGLLLVAAAGNSGGAVGVPARYRNVIAVSAIDSTNTVAPFSCRGPEVELCAPGVSVLSTVPGGGYSTMSGTSMACPHVSGAAALAWGSHRYANNVTIRRLLAWTADNLGVPGRDNLYGYGRVDAEQAAFMLTVPPAIPGIP